MFLIIIKLFWNTEWLKISTANTIKNTEYWNTGIRISILPALIHKIYWWVNRFMEIYNKCTIFKIEDFFFFFYWWTLLLFIVSIKFEIGRMASDVECVFRENALVICMIFVARNPKDFQKHVFLREYIIFRYTLENRE